MIRGGRSYRGIAAAAIAASAFLLTLAAPAGAATQVGETFVPTITGGSGLTTLQSGSPGGRYTVPSPGVITSWSFQASAATVPELKFKVARPAGGNNFTVIGEDAPRTPSAGALNVFPAQIPVKAGDVIGFYRMASGLIFGTPPPGYSVQNAAGDVPLGTAADFGSPLADFQIDLSASLEADCDGDGLGDETQDTNLLPCDKTAPDTVISGKKIKGATAKFTFTSTEPGSSFQCKLGHLAFRPCTSPRKYRHLASRKHKFQVQAIDRAGNVDGSPATQRFKIHSRRR